MIKRKIIRAQVSALGPDEVRAIISTADLARDGHILEPRGCIIDNYLRNPIVLFQHDPDQPVGTCENIVINPADITATIRFAPPGVSAKADEVRGLVKSGVIRTMSIGFDWEDKDATPLDPKNPRGGQRIHRWELFESSFVSVPSDVGAMVTARAFGRSGKVLSSENAGLLQQAHNSAHRAHIEAERCRSLVRTVLNSAEIDADSTYIQGSEGDHEDEGSRDRDFRRRQAQALALSAPDLVGAPDADWHRRQQEARALARA